VDLFSKFSDFYAKSSELSERSAGDWWMTNVKWIDLEIHWTRQLHWILVDVQWEPLHFLLKICWNMLCPLDP
jgi:hypothetical protein